MISHYACTSFCTSHYTKNTYINIYICVYIYTYSGAIIMMVTLTKYAHRAIHFWFFSKQPIYDHIDHFQTEFELFSRIKKKLTDDQFGRNCISKGLKKFELSTSFFSFYRKTSHFFLRFRPLLMQNKQTHRNSYKMRCLMSLILISRMGHSQYNWAKSTNLYLMDS